MKEDILRKYIRELLNEQNVIAAGMCFPFAAKKAEEWFGRHFEARKGRAPKRHPDLNNMDKFKVVHGKVTDTWKNPPKSIVHAWVEMGDLVFDDQTQHTKPNGVPKKDYYDMYQPEVVEEYSAEDAVVNCDMKGEGPWNKDLYNIMKQRDEWMNEGVMAEGVEFHELDSPLKYSRAVNVKRLAYCDSSVTEPPSGSDAYFKEYQKMERYGSSGRRLKKPRPGEIIPGVSNVCIIGFLDYHSQGKTQDGKEMWYIDYMKTRGDSSGQGVASKLIDEFFSKYVEPGSHVHFGKMMRKEIGHLKEKMAKKYPDVYVIGARNY